MEAKKTSLFNIHQKNGAKFVEFAGYKMPIQYKDGIIQEHRFTRSNSGIFDVSHMGQLFINGKEDLTEDLEKIFPVDLKKLNLNQSKYSFLMNEEGGIYDDLIITKLQERYLIILNAACKERDFKIIEKKLKNKYEMNLDENLSLIAIQGPDGFEISIENKKAEKLVEALLENGSKLIGLGARDTLRLEAGLCLYGNDIDLKTSPIEANLKWAISKNRIESNYPGSNIIKNQIENGVKRLRVGIKPDTRVIARGDTRIFNHENKEIGKITSGTFGPSVECSIAMGYVDNSYSSLNTKIFLEVRGKKISANICNLPFYKKNYVKGEIYV